MLHNPGSVVAAAALTAAVTRHQITGLLDRHAKAIGGI